jgi:hypothetical protein
MAHVPPYTLLRDLVLPGAHDASATRLDLASPPFETQALAPVLWLPWLFGQAAARFSVAEGVSVRAQCALGLRAFDLRAARDVEGEWWGWHTFKTQPLRDVLADLANCTRSFRSEVLVIWLRVEASGARTGGVKALLAPYADLVHPSPLDALRARTVGNLGCRGFLFANGVPGCGDYGVATVAWTNMYDERVARASLQVELDASTRNCKDVALFGAAPAYCTRQWIVTPQPLDIVGVWFQSGLLWGAPVSLRQRAQALNAHVATFLEANAAAVRARVGATWGDFFDSAPWRDAVVGLNGIEFHVPT